MNWIYLAQDSAEWWYGTVCIATGPGAGRYRVLFPARAKRRVRPSPPPSLLLNEYRGHFIQWESVCGVGLITHLYLVPRLRMCGAITPFFLYAFVTYVGKFYEHKWIKCRQQNYTEFYLFILYPIIGWLNLRTNLTFLFYFTQCRISFAAFTVKWSSACLSTRFLIRFTVKWSSACLSTRFLIRFTVKWSSACLSTRFLIRSTNATRLKESRHACLSVRPHGTTGLTLDGI